MSPVPVAPPSVASTSTSASASAATAAAVVTPALSIPARGPERTAQPTSAGATSSRLASSRVIVTSNWVIDSSNNFITFFNGADRIAGRVEGFSRADCNLLADVAVRIGAVVGLSLNIYDFHFAFVPTDDWFDPGALPTFDLTGEQPELGMAAGDVAGVFAGKISHRLLGICFWGGALGGAVGGI